MALTSRRIPQLQYRVWNHLEATAQKLGILELRELTEFRVVGCVFFFVGAQFSYQRQIQLSNLENSDLCVFLGASD